jgi:hypothetical protein
MSGKLPIGIFEEIACRKMLAAAEKQQESLRKLNIRSSDIYSIEITDIVKSPTRMNNGNWRYPPIQVKMDNGLVVSIVGVLDFVCDNGLLVTEICNFNKCIKIWPQSIVLSCIKGYENKPVFFVEEGREKKLISGEPMDLLRSFVEYHLLCLNNISPLYPDLINEVINGEDEEVQKKMGSMIDKSPWGSKSSRYISWAIEEISCSKKAVALWRGVAKETYGPIVDLIKNKVALVKDE